MIIIIIIIIIMVLIMITSRSTRDADVRLSRRLISCFVVVLFLRVGPFGVGETKKNLKKVNTREGENSHLIIFFSLGTCARDYNTLTYNGLCGACATVRDIPA